MSAPRKLVTRNRKAQRDYDVRDRYDAGLVLMGSEIKSIRNGSINIGDGYVQAKDGELWLVNIHIAPYKDARQIWTQRSAAPPQAAAASA